MPGISVIIPTRSRPDELRRCLSALAECVDELEPHLAATLHEVVIVDDASATPTVLGSAHGLPVTVLRNERPLGAGPSRARGAAYASGDVLAFLDDDAVPRGDWLIVAGGVSPARPAITGRVLAFDDNLVARSRQARYDARYATVSAGDPVTFFAGGNSAIRSEVFHRCGGFTRTGTGGDNSIVDALRAMGQAVVFEPDLVIAHRNGKGWPRAVADSWYAGLNAPDRIGVTQAMRAVGASGLGAAPNVRLLNQALGLVHAVASALPRS
ncbi:glycosyltransferase family 2 protein [Nocardia sp. NPDC052566]|uniref:glycosyltransferase family 2 protein n=1 Tax=Nocardia sp. NPDC052566 TaxID=3364330 RepID=UPI0037CCBC54